MEDVDISEIARLVTGGKIYNELWDWPDDVIGQPVFLWYRR